MRTTLRIDDVLFRRLKEKAARSGRTIGELVEDAVRVSLDRPAPTQPENDVLPVFGGSGVMPGVDLESSAALLEAMGESFSLDAVR